VNPEDELGVSSGAQVLSMLTTHVAEAMRDEYSETQSVLRALLHPGLVSLAAVLSFVAACVWAGHSGSPVSAVPFFTSALLAGAAALLLELRRKRAAVGIFASVAVGVGWFVLGGLVYVGLLISAWQGA